MSRPTNVNTKWSEDETELLRSLWAGGLSCSQIAIEINRRLRSSYTRNAVIGRACRLKLMGREAPHAPGKPKAERRAPPVRAGSIRVAKNNIYTEPTPRPARADAPPVAAFSPLPGSEPKPWTERRFAECAWPVGGDGADLLACCLPADGSWCPGHAARGRQAMPPRARTANQLARSLRRYA